MARRWDAIVIGAGHNGLACAAYLARAGRKVLVLERRHVLGGAAVSEEVFPGFTFSACSYVVSLLRPWIIRDLDLTRFGLRLLPLDCTFTPFADGRSLARWGDPHRTRREIAAFSPRDAEVYPQFGRAMVDMARFVKPIIDQRAPRPDSNHPSDLLALLRFGRHFRELGADGLALHLKMLTMSAVDFLSEYFESEQLIAPMAISGIIGTFLGIRSPGTAYVLLHHYMGEIDGAFRSWGLAEGGTGRVSLAIADAARHFGAEIRTEAPVARVLVRDGAARGVVLENGDELHGDAVISGAEPRLTFLKLVGEEHLDPEFAAALRRYKLRGSSAKVNLALDALPRFTARPEPGPHLKGDITIAPSIDELERAYDQAKYGAWSRRPFMDIVIPVVAELRVDLVADHDQVMLDREGGNPSQILFGDRGSRRIVGEVEHQELGAVGNQRLEQPAVKAKTLLATSLRGHRAPMRHSHDGCVRDVARLVVQDLVAGVQQGPNREIHGLTDPDRDQDFLVRVVGELEGARDVVRDGAAQTRDAEV